MPDCGPCRCHRGVRTRRPRSADIAGPAGHSERATLDHHRRRVCRQVGNVGEVLGSQVDRGHPVADPHDVVIVGVIPGVPLCVGVGECGDEVGEVVASGGC
jgi:hypothetical protein